MTDALPPIQLETSDSGDPIVIVADAQVDAPAALRDAIPQLTDPAYAALYAQLLTYLSEGDDMELIVDPAVYKAEYERRLAAEDPDEDVQPGTVRLRNYGTPDFAALNPPAYDGDKLVFFTWHRFYTLPYRAVVDASGMPEFKPVELN
ncbi:MAG: hypothetical protein AB3N13_15465 [Arenibacterium sp.]